LAPDNFNYIRKEEVKSSSHLKRNKFV